MGELLTRGLADDRLLDRPPFPRPRRLRRGDDYQGCRRKIPRLHRLGPSPQATPLRDRLDHPQGPAARAAPPPRPRRPGPPPRRSEQATLIAEAVAKAPDATLDELRRDNALPISAAS